MLSGEILRRSPLSVALLPPPSLIEFCRIMATFATLANQQNIDDDDDIYLENGLLSYANPNYHMNPQKMAENSQIYEEILTEQWNNGREMPRNDNKNIARKNYQHCTLAAMGVNLKENFNSPKKNEFDTSPNESKTKSDQCPENANKGHPKIKHIVAQKNSFDLYATVGDGDGENVPEKEGLTDDLPPGWEKHTDEHGAYFWHIKTGVTQREKPTWQKDVKTPIAATNPQQFMVPKPSATRFSSQLDNVGSSQRIIPRSKTVTDINRTDNSYKRRSCPLKPENEGIRFAVKSLGWMEVSEEDLTPDRSSKAVNKCIIELSSGRNDLLDVVGRWGDGKDLYMDLDDGALKLIDPDSGAMLNTQPIHTIRVWGVGRDNGRERDFAYVARDRLTKIHMCNVFRCETAARTIANTLRDICKRIMIERSMQVDNSSSNSMGRSPIRPTNLPTNQRWMRQPHSFPTPMEEPKKVLKAQYIGSCEVPKAGGIEIINDAIELVIKNNQSAKSVNVSVAPSTITVNLPGGNETTPVVECRVRYLSFLGIGKNVKNCAFIMHTAQDKYEAHVFQCEPSSGALCKTIEAACKLRYQKCLDAHPDGPSGHSMADSQTSGYLAQHSTSSRS